jgi:hypothetical protein
MRQVVLSACKLALYYIYLQSMKSENKKLGVKGGTPPQVTIFFTLLHRFLNKYHLRTCVTLAFIAIDLQSNKE